MSLSPFQDSPHLEGLRKGFVNSFFKYALFTKDSISAGLLMSLKNAS